MNRESPKPKYVLRKIYPTSRWTIRSVTSDPFVPLVGTFDEMDARARTLNEAQFRDALETWSDDDLVTLLNETCANVRRTPRFSAQHSVNAAFVSAIAFIIHTRTAKANPVNEEVFA